MVAQYKMLEAKAVAIPERIDATVAAAAEAAAAAAAEADGGANWCGGWDCCCASPTGGKASGTWVKQEEIPLETLSEKRGFLNPPPPKESKVVFVKSTSLPQK